MTMPPRMPDPDLAAALARAGIASDAEIVPLQGGRNNRAFKIVPSAGSPLVAKQYFFHADDRRDRLGHEYAFCEYGWSLNLRCLPRPILADRTARVGFYDFVEGVPFGDDARPLTEDVAAAADFLVRLQAGRVTAEAYKLGKGSEACFSLAEHVAAVRDRVARLLQIPDRDRALSDLVDRRLPDGFALACTRLEKIAGDADLHADLELPQDRRIVSPSDFGFHNALRPQNAERGPVFFYDFEYAGWDDPAKLIGDFFNQIAVPIDLDHLPVMAAAATGGGGAAERAPILALLPIYALKWCCIALNPFLPAGAARRRHAEAMPDDWRDRTMARAERQFGRFDQMMRLTDWE